MVEIRPYVCKKQNVDFLMQSGRRFLIFWIDEQGVAEWKKSKQSKRNRPRRLSDLAITPPK